MKAAKKMYRRKCQPKANPSKQHRVCSARDFERQVSVSFCVKSRECATQDGCGLEGLGTLRTRLCVIDNRESTQSVIRSLRDHFSIYCTKGSE